MNIHEKWLYESNFVYQKLIIINVDDEKEHPHKITHHKSR